MTVKYYAILTNQGAARLANATMLGSKLNLTQMAVGDANGVLPTPDPAQTKLINQKRIAPLNLLSVDPNNQSQIIAEQIIPENEGGFWIREIGLYDDEGVLIAVANCPETYKPQLQEGSGRTQTIRMILVVTNTEAITLKIDPSVVLATRKYVDDEVLELRLYVDDQMSKHIAAQDPHTQYAQKHNPTFTGEPKAPTPAAGNNTTRIATTEFVQAAITALINGAPATLDTLKEIAAAINNDPKFSTTINNALAGKQPLDNTLTHLSGKDVAGLLAYLGLGETINLAAGAVQKTGDEMNGKLTLPQTSSFGVNTNNTLGGSSIAIGDNDTGLKGNGDGNLAFMANNVLAGYFNENELQHSKKMLTKNFQALVDNNWPEGAGGFSGQLSSEAPFSVPMVHRQNNDNNFFPLLKGKVSLESGYPVAASFGILTSGNTNFPQIAIHAKTDFDVNDKIWVFDVAT